MLDDAEKKLLADVGRCIDETRTVQGLSLEQLARLTGISAPALSLIETGKRDPRLTTLKRIADALRVAPATLIADGSPPGRGGLLLSPRAPRGTRRNFLVGVQRHPAN